MTLPSDAQIVKKVHSIIVKALEDDTIGEYSKRKVREMLTEHFSVDFEPRKKSLNQTIQDQVNKVLAESEKAKSQPKASTSRSSSPKKASPAKTSPQKSTKSAKPTKKGPAKRKQPSSDEERVEEDDYNGSNDERDYEDSVQAAAASNSDSSEPEAEEEFSELEEDTSISRACKKSKPNQTKLTSSSTSKSKSPRTSSTGGSEAEQRLARLKKLVVECGVHKPWKKLYEAASISKTDFAEQCRIVQDVLKELGMTGKGSMEQAKKIREQREFANELESLKENIVIDDEGRGGRARRTRGSISGRGSGATKKQAINVSDDDDDDEGEASDFEEVASTRKKTASKAKVAESSTEDSEDEGPIGRSFKSSLASFVADLNSDSD
ncbi:uncharacterized protein UBRO2_02473 [Ustilago bromivora]|uniref:DEK-C domain-containing protein n=1 Tax=Ustilago bromivora TaxID=307758 RepID=A0A8H8TQH9_9BASI|nr:uncharacterized protein UBRO2_02473 [Ustilago bromivora]